MVIYNCPLVLTLMTTKFNFKQIYREHYTHVINNIKKNAFLKINYSLSEPEDVFKKHENENQVGREAFSLLSLIISMQLSNRGSAHLPALRKCSSAILMKKNNQNLSGVELLFFEMYLLQVDIYLNKEDLSERLDFFLEAFKKLENVYNQPLLANKLIVFYEECKDKIDLSSTARKIANLKSVMIYLISSDLSQRYPFFYFAGMLVWSRGTACEGKVVSYIKTRKKKEMKQTSSSGLAYVLECEARAGMKFDQETYDYIETHKLTPELSYITGRVIPYGLYLNTPYDNTVCLDTNTHLMLAFLYHEYN